MIKVIIVESRGENFEEHFFRGLKSAIEKSGVFQDNCFGVPSVSFYNKPNDLSQKIRSSINSCDVLFMVCDNENDKVDKTKRAIDELKLTSNQESKIIFTTESTNIGYNLETFLRFRTNPPTDMVGTEHKSKKGDEAFMFIGRQMSDRAKIHFAKYGRCPGILVEFINNLSNEPHIGQIFTEILKYEK